ncbi:DEAD/DEAH box helicase family protein, partial [Candidatus Riflebacteria bacterium]
MGSLTKLLDSFGSDSLVRGKHFEKLTKWFLENDSQYRGELKKIWLWDEWPERWGRDCGIDLIAETHDGNIWAIQAKCYDPANSITKKDVNSFLSESNRPQIHFRLLIATTNLIGNNAQKVIDGQEKDAGRILLSRLERSEVEWPESIEKPYPCRIERKAPLPHQEEAIRSVCEGFQNYERGQLLMACGTGKTMTALWLKERLQARKVLVLLPSLSLLAQTLREWTAHTNEIFRFLPVCSDETVRGKDEFTAHTSELGLPVTTRPNEIAEFLQKPGHRIVFSTYQSSPAIAESFQNNNLPPFDLVIADEAHRCAGPTAGVFATILDPGAIKAQKRLFMTATPRVYTDRAIKAAKEKEYEIASMDDEERFGPVFHQLKFSDAIEKDLLSDYQVVIIGVDDPTYRKFAEEGTFVTHDGEEITDARTLASHIALAKAMKEYDLKRIISFHGRVKKANEFQARHKEFIDWLPQGYCAEGKLWNSYVSGEMSSGKRDTLLSRFKKLEENERGLLANARCLSEGVDVPTLDGVAFIDPKRSQVDIVQAVGRAIRKAQDKKIGTVILPVFI